MKEVIVIGSGGHAKVVIDILHEMQDISIYGLTSNSLEPGTNFYGYQVIGPDKVLFEYDNKRFLTAMGLGGFKNNDLRERVYNLVKSLGFTFINPIHPRSIVSNTTKIGESVVIFPGAVLNTEVQIGNNTIIATGATIDHETIIGNNVLISAGVTVGAYSRINDNALLSLGSKIISGIEICQYALVGAGAVVVKDISEIGTYIGCPAKRINTTE